jgi:O-antigen ligase
MPVTGQNESKIEHAVLMQWIWLIALLPFIQAIITWDYDGNLSGVQYAIRHLSIPAIAGEMVIILIAFQAGHSPIAAYKKFAMPIKMLIFGWLVIAAAASLLQFDARLMSLLSMSRYILHGLFFTAIVHLISASDQLDKNRIFYCVAAGLACYIAALTVFALTVTAPDKFPWATRMPSATNIRQIANIVAIPAAAPMALLLFGHAAYKWRSAAILFILITFIAWSGSRTALAAIIVSIFAGLIFVRKTPNWKSATLMCSSIVTGLVSSILLPSPSPMFGLLRMFDKMQEDGNVSSGRVQFWFDTIGEIAKHPLTGYGSGRFRENMNQIYGTDFNHPHNFILQFTYDWGIFGAASVIALLLCLMWAIWKRAPSDPLCGYAAAAGFVTLCAISMVDGAFFYPLTIIAAITLIAPVFASSADKQRLAIN